MKKLKYTELDKAFYNGFFKSKFGRALVRLLFLCEKGIDFNNKRNDDKEFKATFDKLKNFKI